MSPNTRSPLPQSGGSRLLFALGVVGTVALLSPASGLAQTLNGSLEVDALRYTMTRTEHVDYADGVTFDDLDLRHKIGAYPIPPRTTVYLALREPDGGTTVEMSYPGASPMPASSLRTASRTVTAYDGVTAYDLNGAEMYQIPASHDDSLYLAEYDFTLPRAAHLKQLWRGATAGRSESQVTGGGLAEADPKVARVYDPDALTVTTERTVGDQLVKREVAVYQEIEAEGGPIVFPLFTVVSEPFDEREVAGERIRVLSYSDLSYGAELREALERESVSSETLGLRVSPNPATADLHIVGGLESLDPSSNVTFEVYGIDGRLVERISDHPVRGPVDVTSLRPGTYVARVTTPDGRNLTTVFSKR